MHSLLLCGGTRSRFHTSNLMSTVSWSIIRLKSRVPCFRQHFVCMSPTFHWPGREEWGVTFFSWRFSYSFSLWVYGSTSSERAYLNLGCHPYRPPRQLLDFHRLSRVAGRDGSVWRHRLDVASCLEPSVLWPGRKSTLWQNRVALFYHQDCFLFSSNRRPATIWWHQTLQTVWRVVVCNRIQEPQFWVEKTLQDTNLTCLTLGQVTGKVRQDVPQQPYTQSYNYYDTQISTTGRK